MTRSFDAAPSVGDGEFHNQSRLVAWPFNPAHGHHCRLYQDLLLVCGCPLSTVLFPAAKRQSPVHWKQRHWLCLHLSRSQVASPTLCPRNAPLATNPAVGGVPQSHMYFLPYLVHAALYVLISTARSWSREEKNLKSMKITTLESKRNLIFASIF